MKSFFIEYTLHSGETPLTHGSWFFQCPSLNGEAILEIKSTLHKQAVEACQENRFSLPHSRATIGETYLQIVNITPLEE